MPWSWNNEIGTLTVDGWAVTFGTARRDLGGAAARPGPQPAKPRIRSLFLIYVVCLFTSQHSLVLTAPTHGWMARLSRAAWVVGFAPRWFTNPGTNCRTWRSTTSLITTNLLSPNQTVNARCVVCMCGAVESVRCQKHCAPSLTVALGYWPITLRLFISVAVPDATVTT